MNRTMTVARLSAYLKGVFDDEELLHDVTLLGEVTEVSYSDKHTFLLLSDGEFSVKCVHFSARDQVRKGDKLALTGSVGYFDKRNSVTFNYREYTVTGEGEKLVKLAALKNELYEKGYFQNRPKLPRYITDVVVITSPDGAAIRDFIRVVRDKADYVRIRVFPVKVQGDGAAQQMTEALKRLRSVTTDAIVLCRGGGSDEDLDVFNDRDLATAVALSETPVISAVGHEVDYTLCDYCAGTRAGTPSIAGDIVAQRAYAIQADLYELITRARRATLGKYAESKRALERTSETLSRAAGSRAQDKVRRLEIAARRAYFAMDIKLSNSAKRLRSATSELYAATQTSYVKKSERAQKLCAVLSALNPQKLMQSGYAYLERDGQKISRAGALCKGDSVDILFSDGTATATIDKINVRNG